MQKMSTNDMITDTERSRTVVRTTTVEFERSAAGKVVRITEHVKLRTTRTYLGSGC